MSERETWFWLFFRLSGRIDRTVYVLAMIFLNVVMGVPFLEYWKEIIATSGATNGSFWETAFVIAFIVCGWSSIALSVKRLHDLGKPGILAIAMFIPVVLLIAFFLIALWPGDPGPNRFGRRPNAPG